MNELTKMLNNVSDSYYDFVVAALSYAKKKEPRIQLLKDFLSNNPDTTSSEVLSFISEQQDFYEDNIDGKV